jgi:hypothetical protein
VNESYDGLNDGEGGWVSWLIALAEMMLHYLKRRGRKQQRLDKMAPQTQDEATKRLASRLAQAGGVGLARWQEIRPRLRASRGRDGM